MAKPSKREQELIDMITPLDTHPCSTEQSALVAIRKGQLALNRFRNVEAEQFFEEAAKLLEHSLDGTD